MTVTREELPKAFKFFTGLCLFIGGVGLLVNGIILVLCFAPGLPPRLKEVMPSFWLSTLHISLDIGYITGAKKSKEHKEWAPKLVILCASTSLIVLIYNSITSLYKAEIPISAVSISYMVIPLILEGSIIYYFTRRSVIAYVTGAPLLK